MFEQAAESSKVSDSAATVLAKSPNRFWFVV